MFEVPQEKYVSVLLSSLETLFTQTLDMLITQTGNLYELFFHWFSLLFKNQFYGGIIYIRLTASI